MDTTATCGVCPTEQNLVKEDLRRNLKQRIGQCFCPTVYLQLENPTSNMRKYQLTNDCTVENGLTLYKIKALRDFGCIKKGDIGGYVQSEDNLSHEGGCWVHGNAKVYGNAQIHETAQVHENAQVYGKARVYGNAEVYGKARVYGNAEVYGNAKVYGKAQVYGNARVQGCVQVPGYARISNTKDYLCVGPLGSDRYVTLLKNTQDVVVGCFNGSLEEFKDIVKIKYPNGSDYDMLLGLAESYFQRKSKGNLSIEPELSTKACP